jgi:hypothetical protein
MATVPEACDKQLFRSLGARAVWLPGEDRAARRRGRRAQWRFNKVAHINSFGAQMQTLWHSDTSLDLSSTSVKQTIFQRGASARHREPRPSADASVKLEFTASRSSCSRPRRCRRLDPEPARDRRQWSPALANWQHDKFFIVHELYTAVDWSFLGTKDKSAASSSPARARRSSRSSRPGHLRAQVERVDRGQDPRQGRGDRAERRPRERDGQRAIRRLIRERDLMRSFGKDCLPPRLAALLGRRPRRSSAGRRGRPTPACRCTPT